MLESSPIRIRLLGPEDAPAYRVQRLQALQQNPAAFSSSYEEELARPPETMAERLIPSDTRRTFGAFAGEQLAGSVAFGRESGLKLAHKGFIRAMYVAPEWRRQGLGRRLVAHALAFAQGISGLHQVLLVVSASNPAARALYESLGFVVYGREPDALLIDGCFHDDLLMVRRLDRAAR